ncbi:hypothetical protein C0995_013920 [Termitomyces sp. Mi166|nr:hypothetical protein C0995_013920 [Termitomyces sp. Mi166\
MVTKISLLKISAAASLLEHKCAAQDFIVAADAVFTKAQGLDWQCLCHFTKQHSMEWRHKAKVHQACINLWIFNKQAPWCAEFGKTVMVIKLEPPAPVVAPKTVVDPAPTPASATLSIQHMSSISYIADPSSPPMHAAPCNKGKGKAKVMEEDEDEEGEAAQKLKKELENFIVPTKSKGCLWNGVAIRMQKKHPPLKALIIAKHIKLVWAAKAFLEWQELVDSNSDKEEEEEEERVCVIKNIKCEHVEELLGMRKGKEIIELEDLEEETVVHKTPVAGPSHQILKLMVFVPSMPRPVPKPIVVLASPVASPSTA